MGEDSLIYVRKTQLEGLYFAIDKINNFGNRWRWFRDKYHIGDYPEEGFWTAKQILFHIAGKKVDEDFVNIMKDLSDKDTIIQGDYQEFPKDKKEDDYVELRGLFYVLFENYKLQFALSGVKK